MRLSSYEACKILADQSEESYRSPPVQDTTFLTHRLHVPIQYILRPKRGSYIGTLGSKHILYLYMEPLG